MHEKIITICIKITYFTFVSCHFNYFLDSNSKIKVMTKFFQHDEIILIDSGESCWRFEFSKHRFEIKIGRFAKSIRVRHRWVCCKNLGFWGGFYQRIFVGIFFDEFLLHIALWLFLSFDCFLFSSILFGIVETNRKYYFIFLILF